MYHKILVALDLGDEQGSSFVFNTALDFISDQGEIHATTVVPDYNMSIVGSYFEPRHADQFLADQKSNLSQWLSSYSTKTKATIKGHIAIGRVYDQILKTANQQGTDLIIVGAHTPDLRDYLLGPNAARIVRHATQSVLVVRY